MRRYLLLLGIVLLVMTPVAFALARLLNPGEIALVREILDGDAEIVVYGNSVSRAASKCETDRASIPQLLTAGTGRRSLDLSRGGLTVEDFASLNRLVLAYADPAYIVIPVAPHEFDPRRRTDSRTVARAFVYAAAAGRADLSLPPLRLDAPGPPTAYAGAQYGDYNEISTRFFTAEKAAMPCPENAGRDRTFIEFMHWRNFGWMPGALTNDALLRMIAESRARGYTPIVYIAPVNHGLVREIGLAPVLANLKRIMTGIRGFLDDNGIAYIDLSFDLPPEMFIDQWCACGHLSAAGRAHVAAAIARRIRADAGG